MVVRKFLSLFFCSFDLLSFAHGFQTFTEDCELLYLHTAPFHPGAEGAVNIADPALAIQWTLPVSELSERDQTHPFIDAHFSGIRL